MSHFSLLLGILSCPATYASRQFPEEAQTELNNINAILREYFDEVDIASLAVPSLVSVEGRERLFELITYTGNHMENSMSRIRMLIDPECDLFTPVLERMSDILDANLQRAVFNIENKEDVARRAAMGMQSSHIEDPTDYRYKDAFLMKCTLMQLLEFLEAANPILNETNEALAALRRDFTSILEDPRFYELLQFSKGLNFRITSPSTLFDMNYMWKVLKISEYRPGGGELNRRLPNWTAFYELQRERRILRMEEFRRHHGGEAAGRVLPGYVEPHNPTDETLHCAVCMDDVGVGEIIRRLPCCHAFHQCCADAWLARRGSCPICRRCH